VRKREALNASYVRIYENPTRAKFVHFLLFTFAFFIALFSFAASLWLVTLITPLLTWVGFLLGDQFLDKKEKT
jgi:hypothetical protein